MIKLFLVDDHQLILEAWKVLFESSGDMQVVKTASNAEDAVEYCVVYRPDIVLLDINLGSESGLDVCGQILERMPKTKVIGLSFHDNLQLVKKLIEIGAHGYLTKNVSPDEVIRAVRTVYEGGNYICEEIQNKLIELNMFGKKEQHADLTLREIDIVKLLAQGLSSKEIADQLHIAQRTVESHRYNILKKSNSQNVAQLAVWATKNGIVD